MTRRSLLLYLDASAVVKLVLLERESVALRTAVSAARLATSELVLAEVPRALARVRANATARARFRHESQRVLEGLDLVPLGRPLLSSSARLGPPRLRTLDAIHVASALAFASDLEAFVSYDRRQLEAAGDAGLRVISPGAAH
ncbi:MAG: type II toxin-antitoxin system VapC family toxin [Thermoleophilaceae bacterium]|nr:type II toxin-antitoxin system VapC family toxin [Thermoleophilaceae bacterium]